TGLPQFPRIRRLEGNISDKRTGPGKQTAKLIETYFNDCERYNADLETNQPRKTGEVKQGLKVIACPLREYFLW
ncbi:unnamed protein product, partial [Allacma fusca]